MKKHKTATFSLNQEFIELIEKLKEIDRRLTKSQVIKAALLALDELDELEQRVMLNSVD